MPTTPTIVTDTEPLTALIRRAMQEHASGHLEPAQALYRSVLEQAPQHPDALHLLGVLQAQRGDNESAAALIAQAIAAHPREAMFHNNLGNVHIECGRFAQAEACYVHALEIDPGRLDAMNNLGVLLSRRGPLDGAERVLSRVVELAPDFADARQNLANHYLRMGRIADAVQQCVDGLIVAPRNGALRRILGMAYSTMGMHDKATDVYRNWLEAEPGNALAQFHLTACTGEGVPERAPDAYVQGIFDSFAGSFDAKLAALSYRAPELVAAAVARQLGAPEKSLRVLDAGCGTGLCAPLLAPYAVHLAGVDLSAGMLRKAVARQLYDELVQGDLVAFLAARPAAFDVVVSADTLCYFGTLAPFAAACAGALHSGGLLAFTVEAHADDDGQPEHRLQANGRYSHRRRHLESALRAAGLMPAEMQTVVLRMEAGEPVNGWLVCARADPHPTHPH